MRTSSYLLSLHGRILTEVRAAPNAHPEAIRSLALQSHDKAPACIPAGFAPYQWRSRLLNAHVRELDNATEIN